MCGVKGMIRTRTPGTARGKAWQSMRIMRRFTIPDLCRTTGASANNAQKFVRSLAAHGYVAKQGRYASGRPGSYQGWRLVKDCGPDYPTLCERCGRPLGEPCKPINTEENS